MDKKPKNKTTQPKGSGKKRAHSAETNSKEEESNESKGTRTKRAKKEKKTGACSSTGNRSDKGYRGRGRGRGRLRENAQTSPNMELSIELTPIKLSKHEKGFKTRKGGDVSQSSTSTLNRRKEIPSMRENGIMKENEESGKWSKSVGGQAASTSDSTESEDENAYQGPHPVSVFHQGRGREKGPVPRRGLTRNNYAEMDSPTSDSTDSEDNDQNCYEGPKDVSLTRRGRGRSRGKAPAPRRGQKRKNYAEKDSSASDSIDSEDDDLNFYEGLKDVSLIRRGRGRGKGGDRGRGLGRIRGR